MSVHPLHPPPARPDPFAQPRDAALWQLLRDAMRLQRRALLALKGESDPLYPADVEAWATRVAEARRSTPEGLRH